jgi:hypothetical protein
MKKWLKGESPNGDGLDMTAPPTFKPDDIELVPDSWARFERAVDTVSKGGPQHRRAKPSGLSPADAIIAASIFPEALLAYLGGVRPRSPVPQNKGRTLGG